MLLSNILLLITSSKTHVMCGEFRFLRSPWHGEQHTFHIVQLGGRCKDRYHPTFAARVDFNAAAVGIVHVAAEEDGR